MVEASFHLTPCVSDDSSEEAMSCELCDTAETCWTHMHTDAGDTIGLLCDMDRRTLSFYRSDYSWSPKNHLHPFAFAVNDDSTYNDSIYSRFMPASQCCIRRNGELMQDPAGHYQDGIFLNTGVSELWPV